MNSATNHMMLDGLQGVPVEISTVRFFSFEKGSVKSECVTVSKYEDGSIVLENGKTKVMSRSMVNTANQ